MDNIEIKDKVRITFNTPLEDYFFGYYGINPYDEKGEKLLSTKIIKSPYSSLPEAIVGFWDLDNKFQNIDKTSTFNYQQGCKLQWLNQDFSKIIFNKYKQSKLISTIIDINTSEDIDLPYPIYDLSPNGDFFVTLDFYSLKRFRPGYSYNILENKSSQPYLAIYRIKNKNYDVILTIEELLKQIKINNITTENSWIDHPLISPDSKNILFYLRWIGKDKVLKTKLFTCDINGNNLKKYQNLGNFSHAEWISNDSFIISCRLTNTKTNKNSKESFFKALLLSVYRKIYHFSIVKKWRNNLVNERYVIFNINSNEFKIIANEGMRKDGHPTVHRKNKNLIVTDTYPDHKNYRHLILYDLEKDKSEVLAKIYSPGQSPSSNDRCDLHPRWANNSVCIDNFNKGKRQMVVLDIDDVLKAF